MRSPARCVNHHYHDDDVRVLSDEQLIRVMATCPVCADACHAELLRRDQARQFDRCDDDED